MLAPLRLMNCWATFTVLALTTCHVTGSPPSAKGVRKDLKRFQGSWQIVSLKSRGRSVPDQIKNELRFSFDGSHMVKTLGDSVEKIPFRINPTTNPKSIDLTMIQPPKKRLGIYRFEKNTLRICYGLKERPKKFESNDRSVLIVLRRVTSKSAADRQQDILTLVKFRLLGGTAFFAGRGQSRQLYVEIKGKQVDKQLKRLAAVLKEFNVITGLHMYESSLTDSGLVHLRGINNVEHMNLEKTKVSDAGLAALKHMTKLRLLILTGTNVTDAGIKALRKSLPKLKIRKLTAAQETATDAIIKAGGVMGRGPGPLLSFQIEKAGFTDLELQRLRKHLLVWRQSLTHLSLKGTNITDSGLKHLRGLRKLREINLKETSVTDEGVRYLRKTFRGLKIKR